ncbi:glutathione S-transferase family protein [Sphingoaurantiacus capsulatus]|uniref:Glutathione S-transferase family protein n=1 Tax=Sphingoaurantiacus capsulatus TaxID=1771310 RepID=A0ABV7X7B2_9SPHN
MTDILLHQYDTSPFSEKVRVCLGIKGLAWRAVDQPVIMPKPDLLPLTGGYRRIPVMQIGADIWLDSVLIVRELERRFPEPTLFPAGDRGLGAALALWTDRTMFQAAVAIIFGGLGDKVPEAFIRDREALSGRPFDVVAMKAAVPHMTAQLAAQVALIAEQLGDGRKFLTGAQPGLADASAYYNLWFIRSAFPPAAAGFEADPLIAGWLSRVAGVGHGERSSATPEQALDIARDATPIGSEVAEQDAALAGKEVTVSAEDYGRDPIRGVLVGSSPHHMSLRREDPRVGTVVVHTPRLGFVVRG